MHYNGIIVIIVYLGLNVSSALETRPAAIRTSVPAKVSVNVADILSKQIGSSKIPSIVSRAEVGRYERAMGDAPADYNKNKPSSWAQKPQDSFQTVEVKVAGQKIDQASLLMSPPTADNESIQKLRRILGPDFEQEWMSIEAPKESNNQPPIGYPKVDQNLIKALTGLNFTHNMDQDHAKNMKSWLIEKATCPIEFVWENLGPTFWPQYIRHGHCKSGHSCSWPSGMSCRQNGSRKLSMLRWVCHTELNVAPFEDTMRRFRRQLADPSPIRRRRRGFDPERRLRRVARLINQLSYQKDGYLCQWTAHEQIVSDECTCSCP